MGYEKLEKQEVTTDVKPETGQGMEGGRVWGEDSKAEESGFHESGFHDGVGLV